MIFTVLGLSLGPATQIGIDAAANNVNLPAASGWIAMLISQGGFITEFAPRM